MLLTGCAALGLLEKQNDRYCNSPLAEQFLVKGQPYYFGGFIEMLDKRLYPGWGKLTEAIRTNRPTTWDPAKQKSLFESEDSAMMALFWEAMHSASTFTARALARAVDFTPFKRLLDIGGGSGAYDIELCRYYPHLHATVYDLPFVTEIAAEKIAQAQLSDRIDTVAGDFFTDLGFPADHDAVLLSMILHDWDEVKNREILRKCHAALPSGGVVFISELLANNDKTGPAPAALMSLNMLIETEGGRNYTASEYSTWLEEAGFNNIQVVRFEAAGANGAVIARKP
jgi:ubiquinone/menaquinone biosynthesis C-methylase UbiE